jgi:hypothetical protein
LPALMMAVPAAYCLWSFMCSYTSSSQGAVLFTAAAAAAAAAAVHG